MNDQEDRKIFAAIAMHALMSRMPNPAVVETPTTAAMRAVEMANALIAALKET